MKVKDFLNWLKENDVNEDSEIEITRFFDNDIVANGNFFENDLNYDKDLRMVQIFDWGITMTVKELYEWALENNVEDISITVRTEDPDDDYNYHYYYPYEMDICSIGMDEDKDVILCV